MEVLVTQERVSRGCRKRRPLCVSFFLQILSLPDDSRIKAQARIVQEYLSIHLPDVNVAHLARQKSVDRRLEDQQEFPDPWQNDLGCRLEARQEQRDCSGRPRQRN